MRNEEIFVVCIAKSKANTPAMRYWLDRIGADEYGLPTVHYPDSERDVTDAEMVIGHAAKRCYMSFQPGLNPNVTKVRADWDDFLNNILESGHGSVLEHVTWTYAIENVTRVFTGEMNRHRAGVAISEGSMRYIRFDDIPWWLPLSLRGVADIKTTKEAQTIKIFEETFEFVQEQYKKLLELHQIDEHNFNEKKKLTSLFRRIIPMGVCTGGIWSFNIRALRWVITQRSSPHAEEEIAHVVSLIAKDIVEREPRLFGDFYQDDAGFWRPRHYKV